MAMLSFERKYRVRGGTLVGGDLFDFWVGPFYVGFFGVTTVILCRVGHLAHRVGRFARTRRGTCGKSALHPPDLKLWAGACAADGGWALADHHDLCAWVPLAPGRCVRWRFVASWAWASTCRWRLPRPSWPTSPCKSIRPVLMGAWGHAFPYGIYSHLDWVSNVGLPVPALSLQPGAHDRGDACSSPPPWHWRCTAR